MLSWGFLHNSFDDLTNSGLISSKTILIFPKNFLNHRLDTIEKFGIINLNNYGSKSYASVVLSDSEVILLWEVEDTAFCLFYFVYTQCWIIENNI